MLGWGGVGGDGVDVGVPAVEGGVDVVGDLCEG